MVGALVVMACIPVAAMRLKVLSNELILLRGRTYILSDADVALYFGETVRAQG